MWARRVTVVCNMLAQRPLGPVAAHSSIQTIKNSVAAPPVARGVRVRQLRDAQTAPSLILGADWYLGFYLGRELRFTSFPMRVECGAAWDGRRRILSP